MDTTDLKQTINRYSSRDLEQRKTWYSPAAAAYNEARPRYPEALIQQVMEITQLSPSSRALEVGCGPGTATTAFAQFGLSMLCLEPNPDFYRLAQHNCQPYPNVDIQNISFEEWSVEPGAFDAVIGATSFHWILPEIAYSKAAQALQKQGSLILLWNKQLQPTYDVHRHLAEVYQMYAPQLIQYEDLDTQEKILQGLGDMIVESGQFKDLRAGQVLSHLNYATDQYLSLLNSYSPYLQLASTVKQNLFAALKQKIDDDFGGHLQLSYVSAFHIATL